MNDDDIVATPDGEGVVERLRDLPVGTGDPNIVGDVGPTDVPPGSDPHGEGELRLGPGPADGDDEPG